MVAASYEVFLGFAEFSASFDCALLIISVHNWLLLALNDEYPGITS